MIMRFGFLSVQCGTDEIWIIDIVRKSTLYLESCAISTMSYPSILYIVIYIVYWAFWFTIKIGECAPMGPLIQSPEYLDLVRGGLGSWIIIRSYGLFWSLFFVIKI